MLTDIAVGGTIWVIAVFVAQRFTKGKEINKAKYYIILIAVIFGLIGVKNAYVMPLYYEWSKSSEIETMLSTTEPYLTMKTTFPDDYYKLKASLIAAVKSNSKNDDLGGIFKSALNDVVLKKIQFASDEAILAMVTSSIDVSEYFISKGQPENVYNYMFSPRDLPVNWWKALPQNLIDGQNNAYKLILLSAAQNKSHKVDQEKANKVLERVATQMYSEFGESVVLLGNAAAHPDKKKEIGIIAVSMYKQILRLTEPEKTLVLRLMLTS